MSLVEARRSAMHKLTTFAIAAAFGISLLSGVSIAAEQKITLALSGRFCEFYPKDITAGLKAVKGVVDVDLTTKSGDAIVTTDGNVKPEDLVAAIKNVKGTKFGIDWYCDGQVMK